MPASIARLRCSLVPKPVLSFVGGVVLGALIASTAALRVSAGAPTSPDTAPLSLAMLGAQLQVLTSEVALLRQSSEASYAELQAIRAQLQTMLDRQQLRGEREQGTLPRPKE